MDDNENSANLLELITLEKGEVASVIELQSYDSEVEMNRLYTPTDESPESVADSNFKIDLEEEEDPSVMVKAVTFFVTFATGFASILEIKHTSSTEKEVMLYFI
jgi:hypothetical protein